MLRILRGCWTMLGMLLLGLAPVPASAETLYSIDVLNDVLVALDTETGVRTTVDPNPLAGFARSRHVLHGGLLFVANSPAGCTDADSPPFVNTIDPDILSAAGLVPMLTEGVSVGYARVGDLTSNGATLLVSLAPAGLPACNNRSILADLSTDANMTDLTDFAAFGADMDGLAAAGDGTLYALDSRNDGQGYLHLVARPATYQLIGSHAMTTGAIYAGMTFTPSGQLWALELGPTATAGVLRHLDPTNGQVLSTIPILPDAAALSGLSNASLPTPVSHSTWGRLKTIYR